MANYVTIKPDLIRWAVARSGLKLEDYSQPVSDWIKGSARPTVAKLEAFCKKAMVPLGYLFLQDPPEEKLPFTDFRTISNRAVGRLSPNLIDTIDDMRRRQTWLKETLESEGAAPLTFVGSASVKTPYLKLAATIRETLSLDPDWCRQQKSVEAALRTLRSRIEHIGVLLSFAGQVGLNTRRLLSSDEFRGFVLVDEIAPTIFVNSNDSKTGQLFTLAHELVHVWIGTAGLFNLSNLLPLDERNEVFCNAVAAELLIPSVLLKQRWEPRLGFRAQIDSLAQDFNVSRLALARRVLDLEFIPKDVYFAIFRESQAAWRDSKASRDRSKPAPVFWQMQDARIGHRLGTEIVHAVRDGRLPYTEAFDLTGFKSDTFNKFMKRIIKQSLGD